MLLYNFSHLFLLMKTLQRLPQICRFFYLTHKNGPNRQQSNQIRKSEESAKSLYPTA